jgi:putative ABC transport system permease protein
MLKSYLLLACRNLVKNKVFSFINIFGLASGICICMLSIIEIKGAYDYDDFHPKADRIYRIITTLNEQNHSQKKLFASSPFPLGEYMQSHYDIIDTFSRVQFRSGEFTANDKLLFRTGAFTDPGFYAIFGYTLSSGSPALSPGTLVISQETANLYFGMDDPIGKLVHIERGGDFTVTGVLKKMDLPSHLKFDYLAPLSSLTVKSDNTYYDWANESAVYTYVRLKEHIPGSNLKSVLTNMSTLVNSSYLTDLHKSLDFDFQSLH